MSPVLLSVFVGRYNSTTQYGCACFRVVTLLPGACVLKPCCPLPLSLFDPSRQLGIFFAIMLVFYALYSVHAATRYVPVVVGLVCGSQAMSRFLHPASASVCAALTACVLTALTANTPTGLNRRSPSTLAQPLAARPSTLRVAHQHTATTLHLARTRQRHCMPPCPPAAPPLTAQAASSSASTQHPPLRGGLCWAGGPVASHGCLHPPCRLHTAGDSLRGCDSNRTAAARRCLAVGALHKQVPDGCDSSCCNRLLMFSTSRMAGVCWAPCLHAVCSAPLRSEAPAACRPSRVPLRGPDTWVWVFLRVQPCTRCALWTQRLFTRRVLLKRHVPQMHEAVEPPGGGLGQVACT